MTNCDSFLRPIWPTVTNQDFVLSGAYGAFRFFALWELKGVSRSWWKLCFHFFSKYLLQLHLINKSSHICPFQVDYKFAQHFKSLTPWNNEDNPWFKQFWEYSFNCTLPSSSDLQGQHKIKQQCDRKSSIGDIPGYFNDTWVNSFIDAVYITAHGITDTLQYCKEIGEYYIKYRRDHIGSHYYCCLSLSGKGW